MNKNTACISGVCQKKLKRKRTINNMGSNMGATKMLTGFAICAFARVVTAQYPATCKVGNPVDCVLPSLSKWFRWKDTR